jgi:hypothetical protein
MITHQHLGEAGSIIRDYATLARLHARGLLWSSYVLGMTWLDQNGRVRTVPGWGRPY